MEISFSQSFLNNLGRIDNKVVIDKFAVDQGEPLDNLHLICHGKKVQVCVEGISGECGRLDFYSGGNLDFTITGENIVMNPERTIFEFNLQSEPKAIIECPGITEDTKFLESIGTDLGNSLYKDIPISDGSLVWKETIGKYIVDRGIQDNHSYDIELFDTKSGVLEERPIRFKSYRNIQIEQGNLEVDMLIKSKTVKHDVYAEISDASFLVWDSPMIDAKVNLSVEPNCINMVGKYVDPGNVIYGNTDCFQFINYNSSLVGFKITGTEGSKVEVLFNRESSSGGYTSFSGTIGEDGTVEIRFSDLPYLHFNGIRAVGPSKVTGIETIMYLEEIIYEYSPNPDKMYIAKLNNIDCALKINGVCDYIEYEKYLGEIKEIGRGSESINSVPGLMIRCTENGGLNYVIVDLEKQINITKDYSIGASIHYATFQVSIDNNIEVNGNIITTSRLNADYKIKIEQDGIIWKINTSPDYINVDPVEGKHGIFLLGYKDNSNREFEIITNDPRALDPHYDRINPSVIPDSGWGDVFSIFISRLGSRVIDGEWWMVFKVSILADENTGDTWRPKKSGTNNPFLIQIQYIGAVIDSISFYAIQLKAIENQIEVWEETIIPGQFTKVESKITLLNTMTKNFIIVKDGSGSEEKLGLNWYYYDLLGTNNFYVTDQSFRVTNTGPEYLIAAGTSLLDLGTGELRSTVGRVINVNRSDQIGSLGTLVVTESPAYPGTWRDLIDNNTVNIEVERELNNIYIQVSPNDTETNFKDEDYEISIDSIKTFNIYVRSNFKYVIQTYGYIRIFPDNYYFIDYSGYMLPIKREVFNGYSNINSFTFALVELDEDKEMGESYIEIRSGSLSRKITLNLDHLKKEHNYLFAKDDGEDGPVKKPNIIRIFNNGTISDPKETFLYVSTTTPKIEVNGINDTTDETSPRFYSKNGRHYGNHKSEITITVPNSKALSYSKYPMKSFGNVREMSQNYSDSEIIKSSGAVSYLEYPLYMKGKEHFLWCVDSLGGFSSISDPVFPSGSTSVDSRYDMVLDADGEIGKTIYIISRYDVNNKTFITEYPEETELKIKRDELEANIKISPQQSIGLDERSQIEYAIPIQVSCNVENNRGNIFLGSLGYKAKTKITDDSLVDVIEIDSNIATLEGIDSTYIKENIVKEKTQNLSIMIFQLGTDKDVFDIYSGISDLGIWATSNYIIPEIGSDYTITGLTVTESAGPISPVDGSLLGGEDIVTVTSEWDPKYFLIKVDSLERVRDNGNNWHWYSSSNLPYRLILDTEHIISIKANYIKGEGEGQTTGVYEEYITFKKYGCNYGLYVNGNVGFGVTEDYNLWGCSSSVSVSSSGGSILIHAGIFHAINGIEATEALMVPSEYRFIGENQPIDFSWIDGNLDDGGNLRIVLPPRTRDEDGDKLYILEVIQPHEYYPLKLYVKFYQSSLHGSSPDTGKEDYKIMFLDNEVDIWSNGTVVNGDGKLRFVHNLSEDAFDKVYFQWRLKDETPVPSGYPSGTEDFVYLDNLNIEEVERSFKDGYVKFRFKPNGSHVFLDAYIEAWMKRPGQRSLLIGKVSAKQGYYCLCAEYYHPNREGGTRVKNYLSREFPKPIRTFKIGTPPRGYWETSGEHPCKTHNDNSKAQSVESRGIFHLSAYRREYNEDNEEELSVEDILRNVELLNISPGNIFDSYGISFTPTSSNDHDAKIDPRLFDGENYVTDTEFSNYLPYVEINYSIKDEFFRESYIIGVRNKITLGELDTGNSVDFYFSFIIRTQGSDEPQDVNLFELSDYKLKFGYQAASKQISYYPQSFDLNVSKLPADADWLSYTFSESSNIITVSVEENESKVIEPEGTTPTRSLTRSVELEEIQDNPEGGGGGGGTNHGLIDNDQNLIDDGGGGGGSGSGGSTTGDSGSSESGGSSGSESSTSETSGEEVEIEYAFYRTAQIKIELVDTRDDLNYVMKTVYIDVEQEPDYTATEDSKPQHVIMDSSINIKSSSDKPVVIKFPDDSAPLDVNVKNNPLPVSISGNPTVNLASGTSVGISGQPISVTGTVQASNIPTDYATSSDVSSAESNIISSMPSCKYTPPSNP